LWRRDCNLAVAQYGADRANRTGWYLLRNGMFSHIRSFG
jgi:hypothetical protein